VTRRRAKNAEKLAELRVRSRRYGVAGEVRGADCKKRAAFGNIRRAVHHARAESSP